MAGGLPSIESRTEVDDAILARVLRCEEAAIRKYVRAGILKREKNRKFALFPAIGSVVEHLRAVAGRQATGDAMKAGAALKEAQRKLTELKLAKLDGQLLSMPEIEALWGDMAAAAKWLFLTLPIRGQEKFGYNDELEKGLSDLCMTMLREVAFSGPIQLPTAEKPDLDDDEEVESVPTEHQTAG